MKRKYEAKANTSHTRAKTQDIIMGTVPTNKDETKSGNKPDTIERMKVKNKNRAQPGNHIHDAGDEGMDVQEWRKTMRGSQNDQRTEICSTQEQTVRKSQRDQKTVA